jgi:hypothetical protein
MYSDNWQVYLVFELFLSKLLLFLMCLVDVYNKVICVMSPP